MVKATEWTAADIRHLEDHYWDKTYAEIAEALGMSASVVLRKAKNDLDLPEKTEKNRVEHEYGTDICEVLDRLHNEEQMTTPEMAEALDVHRASMERWWEGCPDVPKRSQSEATRLTYDRMSEEEREQQTQSAREAHREKYGDGGYLSTWVEENPEKHREVAQKAAPLGAPAREQNGMAGVTGQDHPGWRGGKSVYGAVKKLLGDESWATTRNRIRDQAGGECEMCGRSAAEIEHRDLDVHHVVPMLCGGTNDDWNLMALCHSCHKTVEWYTRRTFADPILTE